MPLMAPSTSFAAVDGVDVLVLDVDQDAPELLDGRVRACRPAPSWRHPPQRGRARPPGEGAHGENQGFCEAAG